MRKGTKEISKTPDRTEMGWEGEGQEVVNHTQSGRLQERGSSYRK